MTIHRMGFGAGLMMQDRQGALRTSIPTGSVVPTLRARRPPSIPVYTPERLALLRRFREVYTARIAANTGAFLRAGQAQIAPMVSSIAKVQGLRGLGFGVADSTDLIRGLAQALAEATAELGDLGLTDRERDNYGLVGAVQRAGELSGSLGFDISVSDLTNTCSREFARRLDQVGNLPDAILHSMDFYRTAAIFKSQGMSVAALRDFGQGMVDLYFGLGSSGLGDLLGDCGAFGEGGIRRQMEGLLGSDAVRWGESWLTSENLSRVSNTVNAWAGAAGSGTASGYLSAAATTAGAAISMASLAIPMPAGAVVSAAGGIISMISSMFGDENPRPLSEPPRPCIANSDSETFFNPQAWTALAICYAAQPGRLDELRRELRVGASVQTVANWLQRQGWHATIDQWSGEVMVREPPPGAVPSASVPMRRLIDVFDRSNLFPADDPTRFVTEVQGLRAVFGMADGYPASPNDGGRSNFLWCNPDPRETFTRAIGSIAREGELSVPFRSQSTPLLPWETWIDDSNANALYAYAAVLSAYFCTVPYGKVKLAPRSCRSAISTGVGGDVGQTSFRVAQVTGCTKNTPTGAPSDPWDWKAPCDRGGRRGDTYAIFDPTGEVYPLTEFLARAHEETWLKQKRIPVPSPNVQFGPGGSVLRPMLLTGSRIPPLLVLDRLEDKTEGIGGGWVTKALIGAGLLGAGYLGWRVWKRSR